MSNKITEWAERWGVSEMALSDLVYIFTHLTDRGAATGSEAAISNQLRLEAARNPDLLLFRNNVGVLQDITGRPVRFGLCNETSALNKRFKSSDFVGVRRVHITQDMVDTTIGQAVFREVKRAGWKPNINDERESAQLRFIALVASYGADAMITNGEDSL